MVTEGYLSGGDVAGHLDPALDATSVSGVWAECPWLEILSNPSIAAIHRESWASYNATDDWTLTQATTGAAAVSTAATSVLEIDSNSTTVTQGVNLQRTGGAFFVPVASTTIYAEFAFKVVDTFDDCELFVGLSEVDTAIIDTSANASTNHIGWQCVTDDGVLLFTSEKATAGTTSAAATIAEATYIKVGFVVKGITSIQQYINGVATSDPHATANVPIVKLVPSFVCQSGGTADPIMHLKRYTIVQVGS